jgi:tellurite resistance protein
MTSKDVKARIAKIEKMRGDSEVAHSEEDSLRAAVLKAIADGTAEDAREMARLALTTSEISFARWCA